MMSITACNDSLNSRTSNANAVCATCNKCLVDSNHFACVTKMLNDVHARTKKPNVVPISTRKPKSQAKKSIATPNKKKIVQLIIFIVDSGCTKHIKGNLKLLCNFVEKFLGTVHFGNDQFALTLGYGDLVQGNVMINMVYYVEGLNHNLFLVGQFCNADLEVAFRKSTCFVRDLQGNDLLVGNRGSDFYTISHQESTSSTPLCLMAKATPTQAWLWHRRLSHLNFDYINLLSKKLPHLNFDYINLLSKKYIMIGLPKLKYVKDQLCSSYADHAECIDSRKSTSRGIQFLSDKLVSWMSKKQNCTAMSSAEAEYVALSASLKMEILLEPSANKLLRNTLSSPESASTFAELFKINDLKAQAQAKDTVILKLKEKLRSLNGDVNERNVKREVEEIETLNIELDHKVTKLLVENEHLKQTYKQLYDSIKSSCVRSKEQCDDLINKVNLKSAEVYDLNASLKEKVMVIIALKEQLNKLKGQAVLTEAVSLNHIDPELLKVDVAPLVPKLRKNRTAHTDYIRHTQEEAATLREIVESERLLSPLNTSLDYALTPKNKTKQIRLTEQITKSGKTTVITPPSANIDSNTPVLSSIGVTLVSNASGSMSQDNTKKNRIRRTQRKAKKNKLKDHLRTVKSSLNKKSVVDSKATSSVINYVSNVNSDLKYASLKKKVWQPIGNVFKTVGHIWKPTGRTFTLVGNVCPLTRIATPIRVPHREPIPIVNSTDKPVVTLVYSRKTKAANKKVPKKMEPNNSWGSSSSNVPSPLIAYSTVKFGNDHVAKIIGFGDYQIGNVTISQVYYVEGLRHNLFSVGQFCDSDLEVAFRQHTCFIRNLDGVDLLTGSQGNNRYTLSLQDMMASSPICLLSKASKTKSWLWHRRLSHLNFGAINHLARQGLLEDF
nr:integrase, catalytic region, zinc finger, CCHC-type, peptidase aspartic, catalytic [Tanacetum cinerariifolium]